MLFLRPGQAADALAQALARIPPGLGHHRVDAPAALRRWDGRAPIPVALEMRRLEGRFVDEGEIFDTGEPLREVVSTPHPEPVSALAVMIGVPRGPDVAAYVEALRLTAIVASALRAPAFLDVETGELRRVNSLEERMHDGWRGDGVPVSGHNPPRLTIMDGITAYEELPTGGLRTRGLRKLGLPDLELADWLPGTSAFWVIEALGNLMISGKVSAARGAEIVVSADEPEVRQALHDQARPGAIAPLRFAGRTGKGAGKAADVLRVEFPGPAGTHLYERQALFLDSLRPSRYPALGAADAKAVSLAIARAKSRVRELRSEFASLQARGTRVFAASRMDLVLKHPAPVAAGNDWVTWDQVVSWSPDGSILLRRWKGDPRAGGQVVRHQPPIRIGELEFEYQDSEVDDFRIEDFLLIDNRGDATGGEVVALIERIVRHPDRRGEAGGLPRAGAPGR